MAKIILIKVEIVAFDASLYVRYGSIAIKYLICTGELPTRISIKFFILF